MTSEIAILNKRGIALAADSAVTLNGVKTTNNVNKLFTLDSEHSIGLMIFGNANIGNVPWEVIFKLYREQIGNNTLDTLEEYQLDFMKFMHNTDALQSSKENDLLVGNYLNDISQQLVLYLNAVGQDISKNINEHIHEFVSEMGDISVLDSDDYIKFEDEYLEDMKQYFCGVIASNDVSNESIIELVKLSYILIHDPKCLSSGMSGLVIAGYGKKDSYPSLIQLGVDGFFNNNLKYRNDSGMTISDSPRQHSSGLIPFAQSDVVNTLINGINPDLSEYMANGISQLHTQLTNMYPDDEKVFANMLSAYQYDIQGYIQQKFQSEIMSSLEYITLGEMASMAETFINLTSFKREFSKSLNTVGGDCDVLIISKGDGPVWIRRKMYFDKGLNDGYSLRRQ